MAQSSLTNPVETRQQKEDELLKELILRHAEFKAATAESRVLARNRFTLALIAVNNFVLSGEQQREPIQEPTT